MKTLTFALSILIGVALTADARARIGVRIVPPRGGPDTPAPTTFQAPIPPQNSLVQCLSSLTTPIRDRVICVDQIRQIPVAEREPAILATVLDEAARLQRELEIGRIEARDPARSRDERDHADEYSQYRYGITVLLADSRDPRAIPFLWGLNNGVVTMDALADFGEDAFPLIIAEAESGEDPTMAMMILERMLDRRSVRKPLSVGSRQCIITLARDRLTIGPREGHMVTAAVRLAAKTNDPSLFARLNQLATDVAAVQQLGVFDPADQERIRIVAANALKATM